MHDSFFLNALVWLGGTLFSIGVLGLLLRRHALYVLFSFGLIVQGSIIVLLSGGLFHGTEAGQMVGWFLLMAVLPLGILGVILMERLLKQFGSQDVLQIKNDELTE